MQKVSFSISNGYNTLDNIAILNNLITTNIITPLISTNPYGDAIEITFNGFLTGEDAAKLYNIVTNWDNITTINYEKVTSISLLSASGISNSTYQRYGIYGYDGSITIGTIKKITIVGFMDLGVVNYSVRVFDINNSVIIAESIFTNTNENIINMGTPANIPKKATILEIQIKKTGGSIKQNAYVSNITFFA